MQTFEIRFDIKVNDNASDEEIAETIRSILDFGADEAIDEHIEYEYDNMEVIPR